MRGYQKRVIHLKNTGSDLFEEAYFILKENDGKDVRPTYLMVDEARKIIKENLRPDEGRKKTKRAVSIIFIVILSFLCFLLGSLVF